MRIAMRTLRRLNPTSRIGAALDNSFVRQGGISPELEFIAVYYNAPVLAEVHEAAPDKVVISKPGQA